MTKSKSKPATAATDLLSATRVTSGDLNPTSKPKPTTQTDDDDARSDDRLFREAQDDPHRLARIYVRLRGLARAGWALQFYREEWWLWEGCRYRILPDAELRSDLTNAVKTELDRYIRQHGSGTGTDKDKEPKTPTVAKVTRSLIGNVLQALQGLVTQHSTLDQPCWLEGPHHSRRLVALANGLIDLDRLIARDSGVLRPHSPKWFSGVCLAYEYRPDADCPQFEAFLSEILEHDGARISLLQEWFGYLIAGDTSFQKFLILVGDGSNGKSVVIAVLTALLGESNVSTVPLELFGQRFQLTPTLGKLANLVPEVGALDRVAEGYLKAFVAGDRMYFDRKNLPGIDARPTARLMLATNTLPPFADRSGGLARRLMILPFRLAIPPDRQDPQLATKLLDELSGIFNWSIEGWHRLCANRRFTEPLLSRQMVNECWIDNNPARAFLMEEVRPARGSSLPCTDLYRRYRHWCEEHGQKPVPDTQFGKEVPKVFPRVRRKKAKGARRALRPYGYVGLAWMST